MSIETSMASYYAERAPEYERIYLKPERQGDLARLRGYVESAFDGLNVLEVACGTGYWTEIVARSAGSVFGTDINEEVLEIARSKPINAGKATFQRADAYAPPPLARKFNGGFSGFWWSHIPKARVREFLRNFHRALAPGARVVFIDNAYVEGSSTPISRSDEQGNTYQLRALEDGSTHEVLKNFPTASELRATVEGVALDVRIEFLRYYWILSYATLPPRIRPAARADAAEVAAVLHEAAQWLEQNGMPMWRGDELSPSRIAEDVAAGLFFVAERDGETAGVVKFQLEDELFWPDVPRGKSAFVHRLAVKRSFAGGAISSALLNWAVERARSLGKEHLRLDCEASRLKLRAVYERFGFRHHSDRRVGPYFVSRYEYLVSSA